MRPLNKITSQFFFLLINIVCVTCPRKLIEGQSSESNTMEEEENIELKGCIDELLLEFNNNKPVDDFLHAFLNIKYETVLWNSTTNINEEIFCGKNILKNSAKGYYHELFYIALDIGLPLLPSPQDFCNTTHRNHRDDCIDAIAAMGCAANLDGNACFEKLYFRWKKTIVFTSIPGTEDLSDEELLTAISRGSDTFLDLSENDLIETIATASDGLCELSDEDLFEEISRGSAIIPNLSDEELLNDFYLQYGFGPDNGRSGNDYLLSSNFNEFRNYLEYIAHQSEFFRQYENYERLRKKNLLEARFRRYGVRNASYADICREYNQRAKSPKPYDNYYAMYLHVIIKEKFKGKNLKNRKQYCKKYLSEQ